MIKILLCSFIALLFYGSHASASISSLKEEVAARVQETQREKKIHPITYLLDKLKQSHNLHDIWDPENQIPPEPPAATSELPQTTTMPEPPQEVTETLHFTSYYYPTYNEVPHNQHYSAALQPSEMRNPVVEVENIPRYRMYAGNPRARIIITRNKKQRGNKSKKTTTTASPRKTTTTLLPKTTKKVKSKTTTTQKPRTTTKKMVITYTKATATTTRRPSSKRTTTTQKPTTTTTTRRSTPKTTTTSPTRKPTRRTTQEPRTTRRTKKLVPLSREQEIMINKIRDVPEFRNVVDKFRHSYHVKYTERHNSSKTSSEPAHQSDSPPPPPPKSPLFKISNDSAINSNYLWEMNQMMNKIQSPYHKYDPEIDEVVRGAASSLSIYGATKPEKSEIIDMNARNSDTDNRQPGMVQQIYRYPLVMNNTSAVDF